MSYSEVHPSMALHATLKLCQYSQIHVSGLDFFFWFRNDFWKGYFPENI